MEVIWKPVPSMEEFYEVSNTGLVKTKHKGLGFADDAFVANIMRPSFDKDCYLRIQLSNNGVSEYWRINQLVGEVFIPNPLGLPIVDHINGVRWDNRVENLRWSDQLNNIHKAHNFNVKVVLGIPIDQYDLQGNYIRSYASVHETNKYGFSAKNVSQVINGHKKTHKGFIWKQKKTE
jgi:hypothetical protein